VSTWSMLPKSADKESSVPQISPYPYPYPYPERRYWWEDSHAMGRGIGKKL